MAKALDQPPGRMTVDQFLSWAMAQPAKWSQWRRNGPSMPGAKLRSGWLLRDGIKAAGLSCEAFPDGMTVKIDEHTAYEPDALVHSAEPLPDDAVIVPAPVIIVEVLSPSTATRETAPSSPTTSAGQACTII